MGTDDAKRLILARRARFVAAALASVTAASVGMTAGLEACGGSTEEVDPRPCLSPSRPPEDARAPNPQPCLTPPYEPPPDAGPDPDASPPQPCLRIAPDASPPQPCLSPPAPDASDP